MKLHNLPMAVAVAVGAIGLGLVVAGIALMLWWAG